MFHAQDTPTPQDVTTEDAPRRRQTREIYPEQCEVVGGPIPNPLKGETWESLYPNRDATAKPKTQGPLDPNLPVTRSEPLPVPAPPSGYPAGPLTRPSPPEPRTKNYPWSHIQPTEIVQPTEAVLRATGKAAPRKRTAKAANNIAPAPVAPAPAVPPVAQPVAEPVAQPPAEPVTQPIVQQAAADYSAYGQLWDGAARVAEPEAKLLLQHARLLGKIAEVRSVERRITGDDVRAYFAAHNIAEPIIPPLLPPLTEAEATTIVDTLLSNGLHLLPLHRGSKAPVEAGWQHAAALPRDAAISTLTVDGNVGWHVGASNKVVVDAEDAAATAAMVAAGYAPSIATANGVDPTSTKFGGRHFVFDVPEGTDPATLRSVLQLPLNGGAADVLAGARYAVAPGSQLYEARGGRYAALASWASGTTNGVAPAWLWGHGEAPTPVAELAGALAPRGARVRTASPEGDALTQAIDEIPWSEWLERYDVDGKLSLSGYDGVCGCDVYGYSRAQSGPRSVLLHDGCPYGRKAMAFSGTLIADWGREAGSRLQLAAFLSGKSAGEIMREVGIGGGVDPHALAGKPEPDDVGTHEDSDNDDDEDDDDAEKTVKPVAGAIPAPSGAWVRTVAQADHAGWPRLPCVNVYGQKVHAWHNKAIYPLGHPHAPDLIEAIMNFSDVTRFWFHRAREFHAPAGPIAAYYTYLIRLGLRLPAAFSLDGGPVAFNLARYGQSGGGKSASVTCAMSVPMGPPPWWKPEFPGVIDEAPPMWDVNFTLGSGEVLKSLLTEKDADGVIAWKKHPCIWIEEAESEAFYERADRGGSTIIPELNKAYTRELLGTSTLSGGFDPLELAPYNVYWSGAIQDTVWVKLTGSMSGWVQRNVACSTDDLWFGFDCGVAAPPVGYLPPGLPVLPEPDPLGRHGFTYCEEVREATQALKAATGFITMEASDGRSTHRLWNRKRVAAHVALSLGTTHIDARIWEHAGYLMEHHDRVVAMADAAAVRVGDVEDLTKGKRRAVERAGEEAASDELSKRCRGDIVTALREAGGRLKREQCRLKVHSTARGRFRGEEFELIRSKVVALETVGRSRYLVLL